MPTTTQHTTTPTTRPISQIYQRCHALWLEALVREVHLAFDTAKEVQRAKFTLYDSVKVYRDGKRPCTQEMNEALANVEIILDKNGPEGPFGLTIRSRARNPFFEKMLGKIEEAGVAVPQEVPVLTEAASESLARMLEKLEPTALPGSQQSTANPYYTREG